MLWSNDQHVAYQEYVEVKYKLFNQMLLALSFKGKSDEASLLVTLTELCKCKTAENNLSQSVLEIFFQDIKLESDPKKRVALLVFFLQIIERQIVLLNSIEEAAFQETHNLTGEGTLTYLKNRIQEENLLQAAKEVLQQHHLRLIIDTLHPEYYSAPILGIIQDLSLSIKDNHLNKVHDILLQLNQTPFCSNPIKEFSETNNLIHCLKTVFYPSIQDIQNNLIANYQKDFLENSYSTAHIELALFHRKPVNEKTPLSSHTMMTLPKMLKHALLELYLQEIQILKRRLTFQEVANKLDDIAQRLEATLKLTLPSLSDKNLSRAYQSSTDLLKDLFIIRSSLQTDYQSLFIQKLDCFIITIRTFGFYFASIDFQQDGTTFPRVIEQVFKLLHKKQQLPKGISETCTWYGELPPNEKLSLLEKILQKHMITLLPWDGELDPIAADTIASFSTILKVQRTNGEKSLNRCIVNDIQGLHSILEVMMLARLSGMGEEVLTLDIIPLFNSIKELENVTTVLSELYHHPVYRKHLTQRGDKQILMFNFAEIIKEAGFFSAYWIIFKTKQQVIGASFRENIQIIFVDGEGGPITYGGPQAHKFYKVLGDNLNQNAIELVIQKNTQGHFESINRSHFNISQILTAGLEHNLFPTTSNKLSPEDTLLIEQLSQESYQVYAGLNLYLYTDSRGLPSSLKTAMLHQCSLMKHSFHKPR